jgi:hypothetical protein
MLKIRLPSWPLGIGRSSPANNSADSIPSYRYRWDHGDVSKYYSETGSSLQELLKSFDADILRLQQGSVSCSELVEHYYNETVSCLVSASTRIIPRVAVFYEELSSLLTNAMVESSANVVLCGDFNCSGVDSQTIGSDLADVLVCFGLRQHVDRPTRGSNLLDILATSDADLVRDVRVVDCSCTSDHRLVIAAVQSRRPPTPTVEFSFRSIKRLNCAELEA